MCPGSGPISCPDCIGRGAGLERLWAPSWGPASLSSGSEGRAGQASLVPARGPGGAADPVSVAGTLTKSSSRSLRSSTQNSPGRGVQVSAGQARGRSLPAWAASGTVGGLRLFLVVCSSARGEGIERDPLLPSGPSGVSQRAPWGGRPGRAFRTTLGTDVGSVHPRNRTFGGHRLVPTFWVTSQVLCSRAAQKELWKR